VKVGDLVTIEEQKLGGPLGEIEVSVGIIVDQLKKPKWAREMRTWHHFIVLTNQEIKTVPYHLMEVQSEDR